VGGNPAPFGWNLDFRFRPVSWSGLVYHLSCSRHPGRLLPLLVRLPARRECHICGNHAQSRRHGQGKLGCTSDVYVGSGGKQFRFRYERQPSRSPSMTGSLSCLRQLPLVTTPKRSFLTYWNPLLDPVQGLTRFGANVEQLSRTEKKGVRKVSSSI
jgi:hypothetical protein